MGWNCEACTFLNSADFLKKCEICETPRSNPELIAVWTDEKPRDRKPVQATLFGGIVPIEDRKEAPRSRKRKATRVADSETCMPLPFLASSQRPEFEMWKECCRSDIPYTELKARMQMALRTVFGVEKLRFLQPKAVKCALMRTSQLVVMATGGGKSLCYQLPAVVLGGTTIVVSPLIALMHDQVKALNAKGVNAALISSGNTETINREIMERVLGRRLVASKEPTPVLEPITLLYVTPEQVQTNRFREALAELHKTNRLALFAIDEAHCLSTWGHDFRKAYMRLGYLRETFPDVPLIACTATATTKVIEDVQRVLNLQSSPCFIGSFDRPNIFYKVIDKDEVDAQHADGAEGHLIRFIQKQHERCSRAKTKCSGIVYCHTRADTTDLAKTIQKLTSIGTVAYHGGLKDVDRNQVQRAWTSGEALIAVATVAFGMGIDLPHVRYVVHWNLAKSPDAFYQESGRAGRDGLPSHSVLYYSKTDASKFQYLLSQRKTQDNQPPREMAGLDAMIRYCVTPGCRRFILLKHFGERIEDPAALCDRSCDFCCNPTRVKRAIHSADTSYESKRSSRPFHTNGSNMLGGYKRTSRSFYTNRASQLDDQDDDSVIDEIDSEWDVDGLVVSTGKLSSEQDVVICDDPGRSSKGSANYDKTSKILSKYEAVEAKSAGFVNFKTKKQKEPNNDNVLRIPAHLIPSRPAIPRSSTPSAMQPKSSDYADKAKSLLEEITKARAELATRVTKFANR